MKSKIIVGILFGLLLVSSVSAINIDLNTPQKEANNEKVVCGVNLDNDYFTVVYDSCKVTKIELNGMEKTDFNITTTKVKLLEFASKYYLMDKVEKIKFINENFGLPLDLMMRISAECIGGR